MNSIQISIEANEAEQEILVSELMELGADGFEQSANYLLAYFPELNFNSYEVNKVLEDHHFTTTVIEEQNWNEVWEKNFQPVLIHDFCAVRAGFHEPVAGVEHEIIITPKMSFGTGHHATTYMMIEQMKGISFRDKKVFDFGTGTGILAILAEKLGASSVLAIDIDEWSMENAKENVQGNSCNKINLELSAKIPGGPFDIILANINRNVILDHLPQLKHSLVSKGSLLLSGLLTTDEEDIINACNQLGFTLSKKSERNNWISLLFIK